MQCKLLVSSVKVLQGYEKPQQSSCWILIVQKRWLVFKNKRSQLIYKFYEVTDTETLRKCSWHWRTSKTTCGVLGLTKVESWVLGLDPSGLYSISDNLWGLGSKLYSKFLTLTELIKCWNLCVVMLSNFCVSLPLPFWSLKLLTLKVKGQVLGLAAAEIPISLPCF